MIEKAQKDKEITNKESRFKSLKSDLHKLYFDLFGFKTIRGNSKAVAPTTNEGS